MGMKLSNMTSRPPPVLVFIEPDAHLLRGHAGDQLVALAGAAADLHSRCLIIGSNGVDKQLRSRLESSGAEVKAIASTPFSRTGCLAMAADGLFTLARVVEVVAPKRPWWRTLRDVSRAVREASALRLGASSDGTEFTVLSASERLTAISSFLAGGIPHLRVVHDVNESVSKSSALIDYLARSSRSCCLVLCTAQPAAAAIQRGQPGLRAVVESFGIVEPSSLPTKRQRSAARARLGLDDIPYGCMIGGWWPPKDVETVAQALKGVTESVGLVVGGAPLDERLLAQLNSVLGNRLIVVPDQLRADEKAAIYHAVDFAVVSRDAGAMKESGLVADALRFRVPLVVSDHDKVLASKVAEEPWAAVFGAGDPKSLLAALGCTAGLTPPPVHAQHELGFRNGLDQLRCYLLWNHVLKERLAASRPRP